MARGPMKTQSKQELRESIQELMKEIERREKELEHECALYKDQRWGLSMLGITADVEKEPELFQYQVIFLAWKLGIVKKVEPKKEG
jgi:hypothetical protein